MTLFQKILAGAKVALAVLKLVAPNALPRKGPPVEKLPPRQEKGK